MDLEATSERVIEGQASQPIWELHMAAYRWATGYAKDKVVVDFGCGTGYGTRHLGELARRVIGLDVDDVALAYARDRYSSNRITFQREPIADGTADLVVSFQVIEHVDPDPYLEAVHRMLRPGGTLLLTTPNRDMRLFPWQKPWNRWHLTEYDRATLDRLVGRWFTDVEPWTFRCSPTIEQTELQRYRKARTLLLPATLPFIPEQIRFRLLSIAARFGGGSTQPSSGSVTIVRGGPEGICLALAAKAPG